MIEHIAYYLSIFPQIHIIWLILLAFAITFIENIFPPAPSDVIFVATAIVVGIKCDEIISIIGILFVILAAGVGSTMGFWVMYILGSKFEHKIIENKKIKFISQNAIAKVDKLFKKWGLKFVAINRFMSGTRAVVSFFAGMSDLPKRKTLTYAGISSLVYYGLLGLLGFFFGKDWRTLAEYIVVYERAVILIVIFIIVGALLIWLINKFRKPKKCN